MAQFPKEQSGEGAFERQEDAFRDWVRADRDAEFPAERDRYHLYVSLACPWAHRIIIVRKLKKLENVIGMSVVDPIRTDEEGWRFTEGEEHGPDPVNGFRFLSEAYFATDPKFDGRVTVPVLWDKKTSRIVSNSDDDLMRMLDREFDAFTDVRLELTPKELLPDIDRLNEEIYEKVNDGVYRAGFATSQKEYERAAWTAFEMLDKLEQRLSKQRYLFGEQLVETDWRLFVTLIRFDPVYHGHFKCNVRKISEYAGLSRYLRNLYETPGVAETVNIDHIKRHYYVTHTEINPTGIVPIGPQPASPAEMK